MAKQKMFVVSKREKDYTVVMTQQSAIWPERGVVVRAGLTKQQAASMAEDMNELVGKKDPWPPTTERVQKFEAKVFVDLKYEFYDDAAIPVGEEARELRQTIKDAIEQDYDQSMFKIRIDLKKTKDFYRPYRP